jgi:hypothetical protein
MINHRVMFTITIMGALLSLFAGTPTPVSVAATFVALGGAVVAWVLAERQEKENRRLLNLASDLQRRTKVEQGVSAAIVAQGELATWSYRQLVERLREDGHIGLPDAP